MTRLFTFIAIATIIIASNSTADAKGRSGKQQQSKRAPSTQKRSSSRSFSNSSQRKAVSSSNRSNTRSNVRSTPSNRSSANLKSFGGNNSSRNVRSAKSSNTLRNSGKVSFPTRGKSSQGVKLGTKGNGQQSNKARFQSGKTNGRNLTTLKPNSGSRLKQQTAPASRVKFPGKVDSRLKPQPNNIPNGPYVSIPSDKGPGRSPIDIPGMGKRPGTPGNTTSDKPRLPDYNNLPKLPKQPLPKLPKQPRPELPTFPRPELPDYNYGDDIILPTPRPVPCFPRPDWCHNRPRNCHWWYDACVSIRRCRPSQCISYDCNYITCDAIVTDGVIIEDARWWLGVKGTFLPNLGIGIDSVDAGSPAEQVGLAKGMVITMVNGAQMATEQSFSQAIEQSNGMLNVIIRQDIEGPEGEATIQMQRLVSSSF